MKFENVLRIYHHSYNGTCYFYTILKDYSPWRLYYHGIYPMTFFGEPGSLQYIDTDEFLCRHRPMGEATPELERFFRDHDIATWRSEDEIFTEPLEQMLLDGITIGLISKAGNKIKEVSFSEGIYPESVPVPEAHELIELLDLLDALRIKSGDSYPCPMKGFIMRPIG